MDVRHGASPVGCRRSRSSSTACCTATRRRTRRSRSAPRTGEHLWTFDSGIKGRGPNRGADVLVSGNDAPRVRRRRSISLRARCRDRQAGRHRSAMTGGSICASASDRDPKTQNVRLTSPGVVYKDLVIVGGRVGEGLPASPGYIRAYDARTGELRWTFHTIPHPGESGYDTWPKDAWTYNGGANNWPGMALDAGARHRLRRRPDRRRRFLRRQSPRRQPVRELPARARRATRASASGTSSWCGTTSGTAICRRRPSLVRVRRNGRMIDAVVADDEAGLRVRVRPRPTGTPLFPIEYRKYPASTVAGEVAAETQPLPTKPAPFARQVLTEDMLTNRTPEAHQWAVDQFATFRSGGQFVPLRRRQGDDRVSRVRRRRGVGRRRHSIPQTALLYVNANDIAWTGALAPSGAPDRTAAALYLQHCATCHRDDRAGTPPEIPSLVGHRRTPFARRAHARSSGRAPAACPAFRRSRRTRSTRSSQYVVDRRSDACAEPVGSAARCRAVDPYRFTGYNKFLDPGRLSRRRAAMGHAQRDRSEHRRIRVEDPARRISRAGGDRA